MNQVKKAVSATSLMAIKVAKVKVNHSFKVAFQFRQIAYGAIRAVAKYTPVKFKSTALPTGEVKFIRIA